MARSWVVIAAINGFIAVGAGAFGAHALKAKLEPNLLDTFEVATRYQMYHALAMLAAAWFIAQHPSRAATASAYCFFGGIVLFSGSLYGLSLFQWRWLGPVTPIGGLLFLSGWVLLAAAGWAMGTTSKGL